MREPSKVRQVSTLQLIVPSAFSPVRLLWNATWRGSSAVDHQVDRVRLVLGDAHAVLVAVDPLHVDRRFEAKSLADGLLGAAPEKDRARRRHRDPKKLQGSNIMHARTSTARHSVGARVH